MVTCICVIMIEILTIESGRKDVSSLEVTTIKKVFSILPEYLNNFQQNWSLSDFNHLT